MTTSKRKVSKKNKSNWRKHSNVKDVEEFLHEKSEVERIESLCSKNDELFTIDTGTESAVDRLPLSTKQKRKLNALKKSSNSIINEQQQKSQKSKNIEILNPKQKRIIRAIKSGKYESKRMKKQKNSTRNALKRDFSKNLWTKNDNKEKFKEYQGEWISKELALHHLHGTGRELVKVHQSAHHKTSRLKAFQSPHPGSSYNPSYKDYQLLINDVIEKEEKIIKENKHLKRVTTDMFNKIPINENNPLEHIEKMRDPEIEIKIEPKEENQNDEMDNKDFVMMMINKKGKEKKLKSSRNKELKVKRLQKEQKIKNEKKKLITDLLRLKSLVKDVTEEDNKVNEKMHKRKLKEIQKKYEPKRLSKTKYKDTDIAVTMPTEIPSGLRNVNNETKLIVDKFNDFQKRNILPVSVDVGTRKRRKIKRFTRKSHRE